MARFLVTGGAGFIGSHIVEELVRQGHSVRVLDNLSTGFLNNIQPFLSQGVELVEGDLLDQAVLAKALNGVETVFHLAAKISVPESMAKPIDYVETNTNGTLRLLEAAKQAGVRNVVISSTAAIYGDNPVVPKVEEMMPEPKSPYAVTKLDCEYYGQMYAQMSEMKVSSLRYFNVFGPRQNPKSAYAAAVPIFITRALQGEPITIYGDGEQTRDFIYVKDVVAANLLAAGHTGVFNVAYSGATTIHALAQTILTLSGQNVAIEYAAERDGDIKHSYADNKRIVDTLEFAPQFSLQSGLVETVNAYREAM